MTQPDAPGDERRVVQDFDGDHRSGLAGEPLVQRRVGLVTRRALEGCRLPQGAVELLVVEPPPVHRPYEAAVEVDVEDRERIRIVGNPGSEADVVCARRAEPAEVGRQWDPDDLHLDPDLREVALQALRGGEARRRGDGEEHGFAATRVPTCELAGAREVGLCQRVDAGVAVAGEVRGGRY